MTVKEFMIESGIPMHLNGFDMVRRAIELRIEYPDHTVCEIEMVIAQENHKSYSCVERSIRCAILQFNPKNKNVQNVIKDNITTAAFIKSAAYAISNNLL